MNSAGNNPLREIPPVGDLCTTVITRGVSIADPFLTELVRRELDTIRAEIRSGAHLNRDMITERIVLAAEALQRPRLAALINATGVVLHTNLGRAPVSPATAEAMSVAAQGAVPLEIDPATNRRGSRMGEIPALMQLLTGAEATLVVNNCAAALLLILSSLASGSEVIVSRGEAIEIGGGFRIPDVLRQSGARLVEVGTTNRTYAQDYLAATTMDTAAYLKVHPSNFRVTGFTHAPPMSDLTAFAREQGILVLEDLGSGALIDTAEFGLAPEPTLRGAVASGVDLVMASGDKLLGGPQAGIISGRADLLRTVEKHPLARAVRADKVTLAGVAETLRHYLRGDATQQIPVWRMMSCGTEAIRDRAETVKRRLGEIGVCADLAKTAASIGGGSLPGETLESWAVVLLPATGDRVDALAQRLRLGDTTKTGPGVFGRIEDGRLLLDMRTVLPEHDALLTSAVAGAYRHVG